MTAAIEVVIPAWNYAERLPRSVGSALACDSVARVIVVDDGSTDNTEEVLAALQREHGERLAVIRQPNRGPSAARNAGIARVRADYLMLLDADDELLAGGVDALCRLAADNAGADLLIAAAEACHEGGESSLRPMPERPPGDAFVAFLKGRLPISHGRFLVARKLMQRFPYPEDMRGQEDIPVYALMLANARIALSPTPSVRIYHHAGSLRRSVDNAVAGEGMLTEKIFSHPGLPGRYQRWRKWHLARQQLSIFRVLAKAGDPRAGRYFFRALRMAPLGSRWWSRLGKYLRWRLRGRA